MITHHTETREEHSACMGSLERTGRGIIFICERRSCGRPLNGQYVMQQGPRTRGLEDVSCFPALTAELLRRGYTEADVKKVIGGNVLRVMRACEATARRLRAKRSPSTARLLPASLLRDDPRHNRGGRPPD